MGTTRAVTALLGIGLLPACATTEVDDPRFDLVTPILGAWAGSPGTLHFKKSGKYTLRASSLTKGLWSPLGPGQFDVVTPKMETCGFTIDGDRLTIKNCFLAGAYFRVRT
jgi:hypothetical protein